MDQGGQVRFELDAIVMPQVHNQPGGSGAIRPGLQPGELHERTGVAGGGETLVADLDPRGTTSVFFSLAVPHRENQNPVAANMHKGDRQLNAELPAPAMPVAPHRILVEAEPFGYHQGVLAFLEVGDDLLAQGVNATPGLEGPRKLDSQLLPPSKLLRLAWPLKPLLGLPSAGHGTLR